VRGRYHDRNSFLREFQSLIAGGGTKLPGLRSSPVSKFKRYILFYQAFDDRIELVRVLDGAMDITAILETE
jgi:plasmid stabilization system protein ParE